MDNRAGQVLKDYKLRERIGAGGFGIVYRAHQMLIDREVAIKIILPELANKPDFIRRFEAEAQVVARLEHPHITPLYDYWRNPDGAYLVMRYLRGGSLYDRLKISGALSPQGVARILDQIGAALDLAHRNEIIHRDIKPGNILLDEDGNAYLADFGIAKDLANVEAVDTGNNRLIGSLDYVSPEQARGEAVTPLTDIYALAVLVYEMLTNQHPYGDVPPIQRLVKHMNDPMPDIIHLDAELNAAINEVLDIASNKKPQKRYQSVLEFVSAYHQAIGFVQATNMTRIVDTLSHREEQILRLVANDLSNREIASRLTMTIATVKWNVQQLFRKLGVRSRNEAIEKAKTLLLLDTVTDEHATDERSHTSLIALPEPQNPYKGLLAFQSGDARNFFGREAAIDRLIKRMNEDVPFSQFLAVVGPSGSGKSSLVKAGVIPALWDGRITASENWFIAEMLPAPEPFENLATALQRVAVTLPDDLIGLLKSDAQGLRRAVETMLPVDNSQLVLVIDQFEELFTLVKDESTRQLFLDSLFHAAENPASRIRTIVTLRADYYDKPLQYTDFGRLMQQRMETVLPLDATELQRAIEMPVEQVGVSFETGLVAQIVSEMNMQIGALPLLQYALTELFDRRQGRLLTHEAYQEIGGAVGALANRADEIYRNLSETGQNLARQMFLRLVTLGEGTEDTRRRALQSEILSLTLERDMMEDIIDTFANYRLISLDHDPDTRKPTIEVAHEAILREWQRLRQWLDNSREDIRQERILARAANDWFNAANDSSYLLTGSRLETTEKWVTTTTIELTPIERTFVKASIEKRNTLELEARQRKERERALERRSLIILTILVFVFALSTLIAVGLTGFAFRVRDAAQENFQRAERIRLAAQAQIGIDSGQDSVLTALLSLRSLQLGYSPEADATLISSLTQGFAIQFYEGHTAGVRAIDVTNDGSRLVTGGNDNTIRIWQAHTGEQLELLTSHEDSVIAVSFTPDNRHVVSGSLDGTVRVFNAESGREILRIPHETSVIALAISPNGSTIASSDESNQVFLWDFETGELLATFDEHTSIVSAIFFSPDGHFLVTGGFDALAHLWEIESGEILQSFIGHEVCVCGGGFASDGSAILTTSYDQTARMWDVETGAEIQRYEGHTNFINQGIFSPDDDLIFTVGQDATIRLWDTDTGQQLRVFSGHVAGVSDVAISDEGRFIYTTSFDQSIRAWDTTFVPEPIIFSTSSTRIRANNFVLINLLPDSRVLVTGSGNGDIRYWSIGRGIILRELIPESRLLINDMALSPQGDTALTVGNNGEVVLWSTATGTELMRFIGHSDAVNDVTFTNDGVRAITGSNDNTARVWDVFTGQEILALGGHTSVVRAVDVSTDGRFILTGSDDMTMRLWDLNAARSLYRFAGHEGIVNAVAFSPDGLYALSGSNDRTARLWDSNTGELLRIFEGHAEAVTSVTFSPDGRTILTGSADQTARLWDIETGNVLRNFVGHSGAVHAVNFSVDGTLIVTADESAAYLWRTDLQEIIDSACAQLPRDFTMHERAFFNIDAEATCPDE